MANSTNETFIIIQIPAGLEIFFSVLFIFLSITATLGNTLILFALCKVSSIHAPTKLLFRCLAVTDLCVGLTCAPLYAYVFLRDFSMLTTSKNFITSRIFSSTCCLRWQTSCSVAALKIHVKIQTRCNVMPSSFHYSLFLGNCYFKRQFL